MNDSRIRLKLLFSLELQESDISCLHLVQQVKSVRRKGPTSSPISRWCNIKYRASHVIVFQQFEPEEAGRYACARLKHLEPRSCINTTRYHIVSNSYPRPLAMDASAKLQAHNCDEITDLCVHNVKQTILDI